MKQLTATIVWLLIVPALAWGQDADHPYRGQGYFVFGVGPSIGGPVNPVVKQVGGGGEGFLYKGLGVGAEVQYASGGNYAFSKAWIGSADVSYHFGRHAVRGLDPFVLGGLSVVGPTQKGNGRGSPAGNFGGGTNLWLAEHAALRFEFRDVVGGSTFWPYDHVLSFRVGVTFR